MVESPSKAAGYSLTLALDAEATAANLEETLQPHFRDNGRMGDKKRPHILPQLTPGSPAALPTPLADIGQQRLPP